MTQRHRQIDEIHNVYLCTFGSGIRMHIIALAAELIAMFSGVSTGGKLELRGIAEFRRSYHPDQ